MLHFAALIEAGESMVRPEIFFRNNTASTLSLLEAMLACGPKRLVFSSTAAVYGEPESVPIQEDARLAPPTPMASPSSLWSKCWPGSTASMACATPRCATSTWLARTRVPRASPAAKRTSPRSHLIPLVLDVALGRRPSIRIFGDDYPTPDGTCIRDYIHVSDLADAHLLALSALDCRGSKIRVRSSITLATAKVSACGK